MFLVPLRTLATVNGRFCHLGMGSPRRLGTMAFQGPHVAPRGLCSSAIASSFYPLILTCSNLLRTSRTNQHRQAPTSSAAGRLDSSSAPMSLQRSSPPITAPHSLSLGPLAPLSVVLFGPSPSPGQCFHVMVKLHASRTIRPTSKICCIESWTSQRGHPHLLLSAIYPFRPPS